MAEHGDEKGYDDEHRYYQNDEASEEDAIVDDEQSIPDEEVDGEDLDENLEEQVYNLLSRKAYLPAKFY